jgi:hypothetical protein
VSENHGKQKQRVNPGHLFDVEIEVNPATSDGEEGNRVWEMPVRVLRGKTPTWRQRGWLCSGNNEQNISVVSQIFALQSQKPVKNLPDSHNGKRQC